MNRHKLAMSRKLQLGKKDPEQNPSLIGALFKAWCYVGVAGTFDELLKQHARKNPGYLKPLSVKEIRLVRPWIRKDVESRARKFREAVIETTGEDPWEDELFFTGKPFTYVPDFKEMTENLLELMRNPQLALTS